MEDYKVTLDGPAPWGFRLQGGKDFNMPLSISRLTPGGKAEVAGVNVGDWLLQIDGESTTSMTHIEAQNKIRACSNKLSLALSRFAVGKGNQTKGLLAPESQGVKYNFAPSTALNKTARPFGAGTPPPDNSRPALVTKTVTYTPPPPSYIINPTPQAQQPNGCEIQQVAEGSCLVYCPVIGSSMSPAPSSVYDGQPGWIKECDRSCSHTGAGNILLVSRQVEKIEKVGTNPKAQNLSNPLNGLTQSSLDAFLLDDQHSLRMDTHPAILPNDSSKKRLIEDTQDWQPRTGTTQSRSFRILAQLTGTDFMQDPDDENMKRVREKFITELQSPRYTRLRDWHHERSACSLNVKPWVEITLNQQIAAVRVTTLNSQQFRNLHNKKKGKIPLVTPCSIREYEYITDHPVKQVAPSGPVARPPWTADAAFADRYGPEKTTTVMTKHTQPAIPTPTQNRNSILQAVLPSATGDKTPICSQCNKIIRGKFLLAMGRYYHPEEFTCSQCRKVLEEGGFFEEKGSIFCPHCYDARFAPNCSKCKKKITGEIMHALKMTWHVHCFTCAYCKSPIRNRAFYMEEGQPYCEKDYEKMFGTKCRGCDFKIDAGDRFLEALGFSWHDTCFVCAICQVNLEGKTFYSKKDKPLCKTHAFTNV
ncbi:PDZ and LIM domain protein 7 [Rhinophrynus dorsalis]